MSLSSADALNLIADMAAQVSSSSSTTNEVIVISRGNTPTTNVPSTSMEHLTEREREHELLMQRELRNLQFLNPGENAVLADERTISGGNRRPRRKAFEETERRRVAVKGPHHDEKGHLVVNGDRYDICDCLRPPCSGCHWPCKKCGSRRCGLYCQINRNFTYKSVREPAAQNAVQANPFIGTTK